MPAFSLKVLVNVWMYKIPFHGSYWVDVEHKQRLFQWERPPYCSLRMCSTKRYLTQAVNLPGWRRQEEQYLTVGPSGWHTCSVWVQKSTCGYHFRPTHAWHRYPCAARSEPWLCCWSPLQAVATYIRVFAMLWNKGDLCVDHLCPLVSALHMPSEPTNQFEKVAYVLLLYTCKRCVSVIQSLFLSERASVDHTSQALVITRLL